jgi:hypothetical protein
MNYAITKPKHLFKLDKKYFFLYLDMLGDASSNVHMQYLREGVLITEGDDHKFNQSSLIKVKTISFFD